MNTEFISALDALEKEKGIEKSVLIDAIENALVSAYKKNYNVNQDVRVEVDGADGSFRVFVKKVVVEEVEDERQEISLKDAQKINIAYEPEDIGRDGGRTGHFRKDCGTDSKTGGRAQAKRSRARSCVRQVHRA